MDKRLRERHLIYNKFNGRCAYCGNHIEYKNMHVDHQTPVTRCYGSMLMPKRDNLENKMPSCRNCNNYKSSWELEEFRYYLDMMLNKTPEKNLFKSSTKMKVARMKKIVSIPKWDKQFYFEKLNYERLKK